MIIKVYSAEFELILAELLECLLPYRPWHGGSPNLIDGIDLVALSF